ncbi:MAG: DUF4349 domain-containing protein [Cryomorphaceae bacterium]|nr:DUF4349 domain-containing protein [Cryomorphaceae bacterium]
MTYFKFRYLLSLVFLFFLGACDRGDIAYAAEDVAAEVMEKTHRVDYSGNSTHKRKADSGGEGDTTVARKIIRNGRMGLRVPDLARAKQRVDSLVHVFGGYYSDEEHLNSSHESSINLHIRIPAKAFDALVAFISEGEGKVLHKRIDARDVTEQFYDLETRLENKRSYLSRYRELVKQAKTMEDILIIEEKIRVLEEEIESTVGRLRLMRNQIAFSTLELSLRQSKKADPQEVKKDTFWYKLVESISLGWSGLTIFLLFLVKIWPIWVVALLVLLGLKWRKNSGH